MRFIIDDSLESLENVTHAILLRIAAEMRPRFGAKSPQLRRIAATTIVLGHGEDGRQFESYLHTCAVIIEKAVTISASLVVKESLSMSN